VIQWAFWVLFLVAIIRLSYVGSRGAPVPEPGTVAVSYFVAPRAVVCNKPNPSYDALVERAVAQVRPLYVHRKDWHAERVTHLRTSRQQVESDVETIRALRARLENVGAPEQRRDGVRHSPFYDGVRPEEPAVERRPVDKEAIEKQLQTTSENVARLLVGIAPGLAGAEPLNLLRTFEADPNSIAAAFSAIEHSLGQIADWLVVETSNIEFQQDRGRGIALADAPTTLVPVDALRTVAETIDLVQRVIVPQTVEGRFPSLRGHRTMIAFVARVVSASVRPTMFRDDRATQAAVEKATGRISKTMPVEFSAGQSILSVGETVEEWHSACLATMQKGRPGGGDQTALWGISLQAWALLTGLALLVLLSALSLRNFAVKVFPDRHMEPKDALAIGVLLMIHVGLVRLCLSLADLLSVTYPNLSAGVILAASPVGLAAALLQMLLGARVALLCLLFLVPPTALVARQAGVELFGGEFPLYYALYTLVCGLAGIWVSRRVAFRRALLVAGISVGAAGAAWWVLAWLLESGVPPGEAVMHLAMASMASGAVTYILLISLTPIFEYLGDYTTASRLIELASTDHPALKELSRRAPGTYQHSMFIATLVEDAAGAIGANALLSRVGAYYHDLGKLAAIEERGEKEKRGMDSALYFAENQNSTNNPHDRIDPRTSASILRRHVSQSIQIIRRYRLGKRVVDIAAQHHGTCLMDHFYAKAMLAAQKVGKSVDDADFRYPGPKPQSKEAALVMIADSVEAAVRSMPEHDEEAIAAKVRGLIGKRVDDGQLDESGLTLGDLKVVERSFVKTLSSMYHARPRYLELKQESSTTIRIQKKELETPDEEETTDLRRLEVGEAAPVSSDAQRQVVADPGVGPRVGANAEMLDAGSGSEKGDASVPSAGSGDSTQEGQPGAVQLPADVIDLPPQEDDNNETSKK